MPSSAKWMEMLFNKLNDEITNKIVPTLWLQLGDDVRLDKWRDQFYLPFAFKIRLLKERLQKKIIFDFTN
jgi:hypothetical protein